MMLLRTGILLLFYIVSYVWASCEEGPDSKFTSGGEQITCQSFLTDMEKYGVYCKHATVAGKICCQTCTDSAIQEFLNTACFDVPFTNLRVSDKEETFKCQDITENKEEYAVYCKDTNVIGKTCCAACSDPDILELIKSLDNPMKKWNYKGNLIDCSEAAAELGCYFCTDLGNYVHCPKSCEACGAAEGDGEEEGKDEESSGNEGKDHQEGQNKEDNQPGEGGKKEKPKKKGKGKKENPPKDGNEGPGPKKKGAGNAENPSKEGNESAGYKKKGASNAEKPPKEGNEGGGGQGKSNQGTKPSGDKGNKQGGNSGSGKKGATNGRSKKAKKH